MLQEQQYNEISLLDLIKAFQRRAKVFWIVVILFTILGGALAFLKHNHFNQSQLFQIPSYTNSAQLTPITPIADALARLNAVIIPSSLKNYNLKNPHQKLPLDAISATNILNLSADPSIKATASSTFFALTFKAAKASQQQEIQTIFNALITQFKSYNGPLISNYLAQLNAQLQQNEQRLKNQQNSLKELQAVSKPAEIKQEETTQKSPLVTFGSIGFNNQLIANKITIENTINGLKKTIRQQQNIISTIQPTKPLTALTFSEKAVGLTKSTMFILTFVLGTFLGFIAIFIAEMRDKLKSST